MELAIAVAALGTPDQRLLAMIADAHRQALNATVAAERASQRWPLRSGQAASTKAPEGLDYDDFFAKSDKPESAQDEARTVASFG